MAARWTRLFCPNARSILPRKGSRAPSRYPLGSLHTSFSSSSANKEPEPAPRRVLLVWHSRTGLARQMADAMEQGAHDAAEEMELPLVLVRRGAADASVEDVLTADGFLFCAPENLASISGAMLEFFHRTYYHAFQAEGTDSATYTETSRLLGRPYGVAIAAGSDGKSAAAQVTRICQGWRLRAVAEAVVRRNGLVQTKANIQAPKACSEDTRVACWELGGLVAATVLSS